jgi:hypothetical protein
MQIPRFATAIATAAALIAAVACGSQPLEIRVQSFPPGLPLKPGTAVLLSVEGVPDGAAPVWHRVTTEGDVVLQIGNQFLFAGTEAGSRTFVVQVPTPGADPFAIASFNYGAGNDENPPLPPVPPGEMIPVIVMETYRPDHEHVLVAAQLALRWTLQDQPYRQFDPDDLQGNQTPGRLKAVLARDPKLPALAIVAESSGEFSVVAAEPLPKTLAEADAFLKKHGIN